MTIAAPEHKPAPAFATAQELPQDRAPGGKTINQKQLRQWLTKLASFQSEGFAAESPTADRSAR